VVPGQHSQHNSQNPMPAKAVPLRTLRLLFLILIPEVKTVLVALTNADDRWLINTQQAWLVCQALQLVF